MAAKKKLEQTDKKLAKRAGAVRSSPVVKAAGALSELADQPPLYTICVGVIGTGLIRRDTTLALAGVRMLAAQWLATTLKSAVKHRLDRARPAANHDAKVRSAKNAGQASNSFPSGHTAGATAVARAVARTYPGHAQIAYVVAATAGAVQIPRNKHYLSDVAAGAVIGVAADSLVSLTETVVRAGANSLRRRIGADRTSPPPALT